MAYNHNDPRFTKRGFSANMERIDAFCKKHKIRKSKCSESYYFTINGQKYRVSNHSIEESRKEYHPSGSSPDTIYILAGKNKIIDIYKRIQQGKDISSYVIDCYVGECEVEKS